MPRTENAARNYASLIEYAEAAGWATRPLTSTGSAESASLTHPDFPALRIELCALGIAPYFQGRLLVERRERGVYRHVRDLEIVLSDPADAVA